MFSLVNSANLIGTLLIRSFEQTDRIYNAMILRGFNSEIPFQHGFRIQKIDVIKSVVVLLFSISLLFCQFYCKNNNGILNWINKSS